MSVLLLALVIASFAVGVAVGALWVRDAHRRALAELEWFRSTFLRETGDSPLFGKYDIFSADGGLTWRNVEDAGGGRLAVKGPADPALVEVIRLSAGRPDVRSIDRQGSIASIIEKARRGRRKPSRKEG